MSLEVETINPIFVNNNINSMISAIRSGQLDPKTEVLRKLQTLSYADKNRLKSFAPVLQQIANKAGISGNINQIIDQL